MVWYEGARNTFVLCENTVAAPKAAMAFSSSFPENYLTASYNIDNDNGNSNGNGRRANNGYTDNNGGTSNEGGLGYAYYPAGPDQWLYAPFGYDLPEMGNHMMSTGAVSLPIYDTAQPIVSQVSTAPRALTALTPSQPVQHPTTTSGFDFDMGHYAGQPPMSIPSLSVLVGTDDDDVAAPDSEDVPPLSAATDVPSVAAVSPQDLQSPEQEHHTHAAGRYSPSAARRSFPPDVVAPLQTWFDQNRADPYPAKETKMALAQQTGLSFTQVNHWFINARKRQLPKPSDGGMLHTPPTPSPNPSTASSMHEAALHHASSGRLFARTSPAPGVASHVYQQPWLSPGPTVPSAGYSGGSTPNSTASLYPSSSAGNNYIVSSGGPAMNYLPTAQMVPRTMPGPVAASSAYTAPPTNRPSADPVATTNDHRPVTRRSARARAIQAGRQRSRRASDISSDGAESDRAPGRRAGDIFQCTFPSCGKSFSSKTWKRHEETKHLPRLQWTCMCKGFIVPAPAQPQRSSGPAPQTSAFAPQQTPYTARTMCAFCEQPDPDPNTHPQECPHRIADCLARPDPERTFARKDHLFQHLRNFHRMKAPIDAGFGAQWKTRVDQAGRSWPCGFCGERLGSWERRARHLRGHFREGCRVETDWNEQRARPGHSHQF